MPFRPGQSGNPAGMKKGTRHKTTISVAAIVNEAAPDIVKKMVELAGVKNDDVAYELPDKPPGPSHP